MSKLKYIDTKEKAFELYCELYPHDKAEYCVVHSKDEYDKHGYGKDAEYTIFYYPYGYFHKEPISRKIFNDFEISGADDCSHFVNEEESTRLRFLLGRQDGEDYLKDLENFLISKAKEQVSIVKNLLKSNSAQPGDGQN